MKSLFTILLLGIMLLQAFSKVLLVVDFKTHQKTITQLFCINKTKLQLHCNGQCFLKKNLKKAEEAEKRSANQNLKLNFTLYCQAFFRLTPTLPLGSMAYGPQKTTFYSYTSFTNTFHLPQVKA